MNVLAVIPCRYDSTRLPGKPLIRIKGRTLIEHVYRGVSQSKQLKKIIIATDDERIVRAVTAFGGEVMLTRSDHSTGTDRLGEVVEKQSGFDYILNIQGDEPLVDAVLVGALIKPFAENSETVMSTLCTPIRKPEDISNPNVVKVVRDIEGRALYFSRYPLPYNRDKIADVVHLRHLGLYGFKRDFLLQYKNWNQTTLEKAESLEQLRVLEKGFAIHVEQIEKETVDVNTPADLQRVQALL